MTTRDTIGGVDLTGDRYTVEQHLVRNKYAVYDADGELLMRAKQKLFRMKEEFPFTDPDGNPLFEIRAGSILDYAGDYTITDAASGEAVAILEKQFTLLKHVWKVRSPDDERLLATIESGSAAVELLRNLPYIAIVTTLIPHSYTITGSDGARLGTIEGQLSLKDTYEIEITDTGDAPKEALVAAAITIDALEGN